MTELRGFAFGSSACGLNQLIIPQNVKGGSIESLRLAIAPMPQRPQYRRFPAANQSRTANSPYFLRIALTVDRRRHDSALTRLLKPSESIVFDQLTFELLGQWQQIMTIVTRIFFHFRRERAQRPVCFLRTLGQLGPEVFPDQCGITKFAYAK